MVNEALNKGQTDYIDQTGTVTATKGQNRLLLYIQTDIAKDYATGTPQARQNLL